MAAINNRLTQLFEKKSKNILTIYFTAGFPQLHDTLPVLKALQDAGADVIEIGMPFSDPIADGETIQKSSQQALENGMTIKLLLEQLQEMRKSVQIPVLLMGYLNPVIQYGIEKFCEEAAKVGVDGLILPDLPLYEYQNIYKETFDQHQLSNVFLVTPETSEERIRLLDKSSEGFIYAVSSSSTTGKTAGISETHTSYFQRLEAMQLNNPVMVGFGISDHASFARACAHTQGAIIGSAFIKAIQESKDFSRDVQAFVQRIKGV